MTIEPGTTLAHYEILSPLGKGGMGEVYRAKDTKLGREVAIKVLPEEFTKDTERLARFEREARVLASLDHPHVASIHGFEDHDGIRFLVMQLAGGEDLSDRLRRGPIPVGEAISIARQIVEALEAAHEQGIVHRDLKPANIKIDEDGRVKVLDFGLAKAMDVEVMSASGSDITNSPTMIRAATNAGVILGTAAYMSPEQARGKKVDKRADIWAFGVVLWEILTGERLFAGETVSDTLASVLKQEPNWNELPGATPQSIRRVLHRCLAKNPKERMRDIGDARLELGERDEPGEGPLVAAAHGTSRIPWIVATAAIVIALAAVAMMWRSGASKSESPVVYLRVPLEPAEHLADDPSVAISPDGTTVMFLGQVEGRTHLLSKKLASSEVSVVPGSEGATRPSFSPDGSSIAFGARGTIWKAALSGGDAVPVANENASNGICWSSNGSMIFNGSWATGLKQVPESGGTPVAVTTAEPGTSHLWPYCVPDGKHVLFTRWASDSSEAISINSVNLSTGETREIIRSAAGPRVHPSGYMTFLRGSTLMAVRFDPEQLQVQGDPVALVSKVSYNTGDLGASYDLSRTGTLVYVPASETPDPKATWVDFEGVETGQIEPMLREWGSPAISPDGSKLLVTEYGPAFQIWIIDLEGGPRTQLTNRYDNGSPIWTPDGDVIFSSNRNGRYEILRQAPDGTGTPEILVGGEGAYPDAPDVSFDGRYLLYSDIVAGDDRDLWYLELDKKGEPTKLLASPGVQRYGVFSSDGRYVAYQSTISGRDEIYVTPFPGPGTSWQISNGGGYSPVWGPDGRSLFYHDGSGGVMRVATTPGSEFRASKPQKLFERSFQMGGGDDFEISRDGTNLLFIDPPDMTRYGQLNIVLNWAKVLEEKLPRE